MNEEEIKAIEFMKEYKDVVYKIPFKTILNLINKQQKEIDTHIETENDYEHELARKEEEIEQLNEIKQQICNEELISQDYVQENFIKKDKIIEKIKKYEKLDKEEFAKQGNFETEISLLKELLEE